jgi:hypothetical protein
MLAFESKTRASFIIDEGKKGITFATAHWQNLVQQRARELSALLAGAWYGSLLEMCASLKTAFARALALGAKAVT